MTRVPDHEHYDPRYPRHLGYDAERLLDHAGPIDGAEVLDLACGPGKATLAALGRGARSVMAVDFVHDVVDRLAAERPDIQVRAADVIDALKSLTKPYDVILCLQAVNYWLLDCPPDLLAKRLKPGGRFVFNTVNTAPPTEPSSSDHATDGRRFHDTIYRVGNRIYHVQSAAGLEPHVNFFDWIPRKTFQSMLGPHLTLDERVEGNVSVWVCTRQ